MILRPSVIAPRYILAPLLLFVPVVVLAAERIMLSPDTTAGLKTGLLLSVFLAGLASLWHLTPLPGAMLTKLKGDFTQCRLASGECESLRTLSEQARQGDRVLIVSYYPYWLRSDLLQCRDQQQEQGALAKADDPIAWLRLRGFRYAAIDPTLAEDLDVLLMSQAEIPGSGISRLENAGILGLYHIETEAGLTPVCQQVSPGQWQLQGAVLED